MNKRSTKIRKRSTAASGTTRTVTAKTLVLMAICGCILLAGFFFAALQHFNTIDLGIRNSRMRKQLEDLESENRRLLLMKEIALSPAEVKRSATNLGFRSMTPEEAMVSTTAAAKSAAKTEQIAANKQLVQLTASQRPAVNNGAKESSKAAVRVTDASPKKAVAEKKTADKKVKEIETVAKLR